MNELEQSVDRAIRKYKAANIRRVFLYGCSNETAILAEYLEKEKIKVEAILDGDKRKDNSRWCGIKVVSPEHVLAYPTNDYCVFLWSMHKIAMLARLHELHCKNIEEIDISRDSREYLDERLIYLTAAMSSFEHIKNEYRADSFLIAPIASGDVYIALSYLEAWKKKNRINDVCIIGNSKNASDICTLYKIKNYVNISEFDRRRLIYLSSIYGNSINLKILSPWELSIRNSYFPNGENEIVFHDKYRYEVFDLEEGEEPLYPAIKQGMASKEAKKAVLAPYAYSTPAPIMQMGFWELLVQKLRKCNFEVYTLGYGVNEPPVTGSEIIRFSYEKAGEVLGENDVLIAARSGLCDILHGLKCHKVVLFSNKKMPASMKFYGMKENYPDFIGDEINCDETSLEQIVARIIRSVSDGI